MRGDADPAAAGGFRLTTTERNAAVATALLLVLTLATGGVGSFALPLLAGALVALVRYVGHPGVLLAPAAVALLLLLVNLLLPTEGSAVLPALAVALAAVPGLLWRREARRGPVRARALETEPRPEPVDARCLPPLTPQEEQVDLERALASVATRLGARDVVVWGVESYRGVAHARAASGTRPSATIRLSGDPLGWCWEEGIRLRLTQTPRWAAPGSVVIADRLRRLDEDGYIATFGFDPGRDLPDELAFEEAAVYLRGVLSLHDVGSTLSSTRRRLDALLAGIRQMPGELELGSLASDLCLTAMSITGGTGAVIGSAEGTAGEILACAGHDGGPRQGDRFSAPESELGLALAAGAPIVRTAADWALSRTSVAGPAERWHHRPRALAALPLRGATGAVGVLGVWTSRERALDEEGLQLLGALSPYAALHLEHARSFRNLRETAARDPLTQLRNRRGFEEVFAVEASRFGRYQRPISLMVLDLDHFKRVNDQYGHEAGDEVLRRVAALLGTCIRDVDTAARMGGEEFVVLLPETSLAAAQEVAERVRSAVSAQPVPWRGTPIPVRVSIGISSCPERVAEPGELFGSADAALYRAKEGGRDRVVVAEGG